MNERVRIIYDGREFTIPGVGQDEMRRRVEAALAGPDPWLEVTSGFGRGVVAFLRMSPGVPITLLYESSEASDSAVADTPVDPDPLA